MSRPDFTKTWASSRPSIPTISGPDYALGFANYLGAIPPSTDDHDYIMNLQDQRAVWLGAQMLKAVGHEWQSDISYDQYAVVRSIVNGRLYRSLVASNLGNEPSASPLSWSIGIENPTGTVGQTRNAKISVTTASASATFNADSVIVQNAPGGAIFKLSSLSNSVNLSTTGAGGMDVGLAPVSGYVALYVIYNPIANATSMLAVDSTAIIAPEVYGGANMPTGYTASALVAVWPTNASRQFIRGVLNGRKLTRDVVSILSTSTQQAPFLNFTLVPYVPKNAKRIWGTLTGQSTLNSAIITYIAADNLGLGAVYGGGASTGTVNPFELDLVVPQQAAYSFTSSAGSPTMNYYLTAYEI
jgi:hypothetical protein